MSNEVADHLDRAADYVVEHGHCKGRYRDDEGRVCAAGALSATTRLIGSFSAASKALERVAGSYTPDWNDTPERTAAEVVQALRDAAVKERGDEYRGGAVWPGTNGRRS